MSDPQPFTREWLNRLANSKSGADFLEMNKALADRPQLVACYLADAIEHNDKSRGTVFTLEQESEVCADLRSGAADQCLAELLNNERT